MREYVFGMQAAYKLMARDPNQFDLVVTGSDARLSKAALGKQAMLDLHAGTNDKWVIKVCPCSPGLSLQLRGFRSWMCRGVCIAGFLQC